MPQCTSLCFGTKSWHENGYADEVAACPLLSEAKRETSTLGEYFSWRIFRFRLDPDNGDVPFDRNVPARIWIRTGNDRSGRG